MAKEGTQTSAPATAADHAAMGHDVSGAAGGKSVAGETKSAHAGAASGAEDAVPSALGFDATMLVALAMLIVIGIGIWKKVPAMIAGILDKQIADIQAQLDAATNLRAEAEAIKAEYQAKAKQAALDAESMKANAVEEAKQIIATAKMDAANMVVRRTKMAEDKISAAEAAAIADVRAVAAATAASAAAHVIVTSANAKTDAELIDASIASLN